MTDDEILGIQNRRIKGGRITVHEIWKGQVLYAAKLDGEDDWRCLRKPKGAFIEAWDAAQ